MRLFSYCIAIDDGAAPNPYWGICTLTICKPVIRRIADLGDWVIGVGSKNALGRDYSGKLVYAMQVTDIMTLRQYDGFCRTHLRGKIPNLRSQDYKRKIGDCIYDFSGLKRGKQRPGVHQSGNKVKDLRGKNALLSDHFYYFGDKAIDIPHQFAILIRNGQGHQSTKNEAIKGAFIDWLTSSFKPNKLYGEPQIKLQFTKGKSGDIDCARIRCDSADEDELCESDC